LKSTRNTTFGLNFDFDKKKPAIRIIAGSTTEDTHDEHTHGPKQKEPLNNSIQIGTYNEHLITGRDNDHHIQKRDNDYHIQRRETMTIISKGENNSQQKSSEIEIKKNSWILTGNQEHIKRIPRKAAGDNCVFDPDWGWAFPDQNSAEECAERQSKKCGAKIGTLHIYSDLCRMKWSGDKAEQSLAGKIQRAAIERVRVDELRQQIEFKCFQSKISPSFLEGEALDSFDDKDLAIYKLLKPSFDEWKMASDELAELEKGIEKSRSKVAKKQGDLSKKQNDERKIIQISPGELHILTSSAEEALLNASIGIYQRGRQLVRIVTEASRPKTKVKPYATRFSGIKRSSEALVIMEIDSVHLTECMGRVVRWERHDERKDEWKECNAPEKVARTLIARAQWSFPYLTAIIQAPTLRDDGSILEEAGYDEESGLFFDPGTADFPAIPRDPSYEDAIEAKDRLLTLISGFPFDGEDSRSVAISAILTALIRRSIKTAPLHGFSAPKMGSGKSLLADVVGLIATGMPNAVVPQASDETEEKKRLLSVLMEGDPIVCFDNIEHAFSSSALCSILTQEFYKDRLLGANKTITLPTNALFLATGNNLTFVGDISTRTLLCRLDPNCESPEEREFHVDLHKYIPAHRGELVQAALTILLAYHKAGRPKQNFKQFGRFEEWSDWVRSAIVWVGMEDPCTTRKEIESADPERVALRNLLEAWFAVFDDFSIKTKDLIKKANFSSEDGDERIEALKDALLSIAPDRCSEINERSLGKKLSQFKGRVENGLRLDSVGLSHQASLWRVKRVVNR